MSVPYTFQTASGPLPLSQLDANFATPITLGNTPVYLGSSYTTLDGITFTNANIASATITTATVTNQLNLTNASDYNLYASGAGDNYMAGSLGIGSTSLTDRTLALGKTITGATAAYGVVNNGIIQSDVTTLSQYYRTTASTAAAAFTLTTLDHFSANQGTIGAGSAVTGQVGFSVTASLTGATNNYGFYGNIAAATGRWNLYMGGTAGNYLAGSLGIGTTTLTGYNLIINKNLTGATSSTGMLNAGQIQSDVTGTAAYFSTTATTAAASFTVAALRHYQTVQGSFGAGSAVTLQEGFYASFSGGATNIGFRGAIAAAAANWNFYADGTANNYMAGSLGIGSTNLTSTILQIGKAPTGGAFTTAVAVSGVIQSDVTSRFDSYLSFPATLAASFTLSQLNHYGAYQNTLGASSAITNQYGFFVDASLTGATNNHAFRGSLAAATGRYNLYMSGTADNYIAGAVGIGSVALTGSSLYIGKALTGAVGSSQVNATYQINSDVTTSANTFASFPSTQAAAFTLGSLRHYFAGQSTFGAGSGVTNQIAYYADTTITGSTNDYGFYGGIPAATGTWNLYMAGTANNYLAGKLGIGSTTLTDRNIGLALNITGGTTAYQVLQNGTVQSDVTTQAYNYRSVLNTAAAAFTLGTYQHFYVAQGTIGAGSAVTTQGGYVVDAGFIGATFNRGFWGAIPAGTNRYNIYMDGTADNYLAGSLGVGVVPIASINLRLSKNITGAVVSYGMTSQGDAQSDVTTTAMAYYAGIGTAASSFTLANLMQFQAQHGTIGATSTVTNTYGFYVNASNTGGTNNYGFYGNIAAASGRYNLYMNGTADNYLAGKLGVNGLPFATTLISTAGTHPTTGTTIYGVYASATAPATATLDYSNFVSIPSTTAAAFTLATLRHFYAVQGTIGATSAVTNQYGFVVGANLTGATNNYAFYGDIPAAANRWNLYMNGNASNYMAGSLGIGSTAVGTTAGSLVIAGLFATSAAAPTIVSAATIAPTKPISFVSGTTAVVTITPPSPISAGGGQITLIPTGLWTTTTAGNIALATTAVVNKALILTYDVTTTKWYPSY